MKTAESVVPPVFKSDGQVEPSEDLPVSSKALSKSGRARRVEGEPGVRSVAGSMVVAGQETASRQGVWLNCNEKFTPEEESAGVCANPCGVIVQESIPRMQMDRGGADVEESKQKRVRGPSTLTTATEKIEYEVMRTALRNECDTYAKGRAKDSHRCPTRESSESLAARGRRLRSWCCRGEPMEPKELVKRFAEP